MEENQIQTETSFNEGQEPDNLDNSALSKNEDVYQTTNQTPEEGQSAEMPDPSEKLILGKFKSVDDLSKAYEELQRYQGHCSEELGELRKNALAYKQFNDTMERLETLQNMNFDRIRQDQEKYNNPEYFHDPSFRAMYGEALMALGDNLDTDRFVNLLEGYVSSRLLANERKRAAQKENQQAVDSMTYSKNSKSSFNPPHKRLDEMTQKEMEDLIDKYI